MKRALIALLAFHGAASAEPLLYACSLYQSTAPDSPINSVDQIIIDKDAPSIELRDSSTIGAVNERVFKLTAAATSDGRYQVVTTEDGDVWRAAGFWDAMPYFLMTGGVGRDFTMILTVGGGYPTPTYMFDCPLN